MAFDLSPRTSRGLSKMLCILHSKFCASVSGPASRPEDTLTLHKVVSEAWNTRHLIEVHTLHMLLPR